MCSSGTPTHRTSGSVPFTRLCHRITSFRYFLNTVSNPTLTQKKCQELGWIGRVLRLLKLNRLQELLGCFFLHYQHFKFFSVSKLRLPDCLRQSICFAIFPHWLVALKRKIRQRNSSICGNLFMSQLGNTIPFLANKPGPLCPTWIIYGSHIASYFSFLGRVSHPESTYHHSLWNVPFPGYIPDNVQAYKKTELPGNVWNLLYLEFRLWLLSPGEKKNLTVL